MKYISNVFVIAARVWRRIPLLFLLALTACDDEKSTAIDNPGEARWNIAAAEAQNLDGDKLAQMLTLIDEGAYGEIHSLLILRNDSLVIEEYFNDYDRSQVHIVYSVTNFLPGAMAVSSFS